jgi:retron-type reverse transcriptase
MDRTRRIGETMQTSLQGIAEKAANQKEHRFGNLYERLNEELLHEGWRKINKNAAHGVDKISAREYERNLEENIKDLVDRLRRKSYRAKLLRRHYIPKGGGTKAPPWDTGHRR